RPVVGHPAGRADARAAFFGRGLALAEMEIRRDRDVAVMREAARDLLRRPVPAWHVVNDDDAPVRPGADGACEVRVDLVALVAEHQNRLGEERFVAHAGRSEEHTSELQSPYDL